jgi:glycosyltransferase involved in cell wall biosynthesis
VFHGYVDAEMSRRIDAAGARPRVSSTVVAPTDVFKVVETCDMGFLAYNSERPDFHYIANASGQLVEFLRCGKPVIAFGRSNLQQLIEGERIGVHIEGISELRDAIRTIAADYDAYSQNCLRLFAERYDLGKRIPPLLDWLATQGRD